MKSVSRLSLALLCTTPAAFAQHTDLEEVVVTASPLRSSALNLAQSAVVLAGDDLARSLSSSIGESLAAQPGVTASYFGPKSSRPIIRGLSGERVLMLLDGVSALDVSNLSPDHSVAVEPLLADQIEILKGPTTLLYGSGAVGGVVNTVDGRIPARSDRGPIEGAVELRGETATDELSFAGRLDGTLGSFGWHLDGYRRDTDDVEIPGTDLSHALIRQLEAAGEPVEATRGHVPNSDSESDGYTTGLSWIGDRSLVGVSWGRATTNYGLPGPGEHAEEEALATGVAALATGPEAAVRIDQESDRVDFKAEWRELGALFESVALRAAYMDYQHVELEGDEVGTRFDQAGLDTRLHLGHKAIGGWTGTLGVQYTSHDLDAVGAEAYVPPSDTTGLGLFLVEQQRFGDWTVDFGGRVERQEIAARTEAPDYSGTAFSAAAGLLWNWTESLAVALHLTRSERHPQAAELYADGPHLAVRRFEIGDPGLDTEVAQTVDLGMRRTGTVSWRASVFVSDFRDYIYTLGTGAVEDGLPVYGYRQDDAEFYGVEGEVEIPLWSGADRGVSARLGADYVRGKLANGDDLPQMPPLRLTAALEYDAGPLHSVLHVAWHDAQDRLAENELPTDGYTLLDFEVSYRWERWQPGVLFFVKGSNLLDEEARRHASPLKDYVPLPGRSLLVGIRLAR